MIYKHLRILLLITIFFSLINTTQAQSEKTSLNNLTILKINPIQYSDKIQLTNPEKQQIEAYYKKSFTSLPLKIIWYDDKEIVSEEKQNIGILTIQVDIKEELIQQTTADVKQQRKIEKMGVLFIVTDTQENSLWNFSSQRTKSSSTSTSFNIYTEQMTPSVNNQELISFNQSVAKTFPKQYTKAADKFK